MITTLRRVFPATITGPRKWSLRPSTPPSTAASRSASPNASPGGRSGARSFVSETFPGESRGPVGRYFWTTAFAGALLLAAPAAARDSDPYTREIGRAHV